jgi:uncharacterized SAM-binding protein YcdF (DUF218 family)
MAFILSKLLLILILPLTWIFGSLLYAVITKQQKRKQRMLVVTIIILYLFSNSFLVNILARTWDINPYKADTKTYSSIILLGGFVSEDAEANGFFNWTVDRFTQATRLLKAGKASHLLFTGGNADINPDGFTEAAFVKTELKLLNIPDSIIILEDRARNTIENAAFSKPLLQKVNLNPPYLLVTSAFHMRRALLIFKKAGIPVVAYPCNYTTTQKVSFKDFIPSADALSQWGLYIKEVAGYLFAWFK